MNRTVKMVSIVVAIAMVIAVMCTGIYAATNVNVQGTSSITFKATDVYATVTVDSQKEENGNNGVYIQTFTDANLGSSDNDIYTDALNFIDFALSSKTKTATVKATVKNDFDIDSGVLVNAIINAKAMKDGEEYADVIITVEAEGATYNAETGIVIAEAATQTFVITISVSDAVVKNGLPEGVTFAFDMVLTRA